MSNDAGDVGACAGRNDGDPVPPGGRGAGRHPATLHSRVNDLCARLSIRQNSRAQSKSKITYYTPLDSQLDTEIAAFLRHVDNAVDDERERCAKIADSMNSTQNIGDRIRYGLGHADI